MEEKDKQLTFKKEAFITVHKANVKSHD